jgi:putative acetyltransferase
MYLRTEKCILRPFLTSDLAQIIETIDCGFLRNLTVPMTWPLSEAWIKKNLINKSEHIYADRHTFAIQETDDNKIVGALDIFNIDYVHRRGSLGILLYNEAWVGKGIGKVCLESGIDIAFNWIGLNKLQCTIYCDNTRSVNLFEKAGFTNDCTLREHFFRDGEFIDAFLYSLTKAQRTTRLSKIPENS